MDASASSAEYHRATRPATQRAKPVAAAIALAPLSHTGWQRQTASIDSL